MCRTTASLFLSLQLEERETSFLCFLCLMTRKQGSCGTVARAAGLIVELMG